MLARKTGPVVRHLWSSNLLAFTLNTEIHPSEQLGKIIGCELCLSTVYD